MDLIRTDSMAQVVAIFVDVVMENRDDLWNA